MEQKHQLLKAAFSLILLVSVSCSARAQQSQETIKMVDDFSKLSGVSMSQPEGQIIYGTIAQRDHWPATLVFLTAQGACTATAVGRRVVLTAAHCVEDGQTGTVTVSTAGTTATLTCSHHPMYLNEISADYALCLTGSPLPYFGTGYERISTDPNLISVNSQILLLGYGCTTNVGQRDFGNLYHGFAQARRADHGRMYFLTKGGAAVCFGDSGGGAYWVESPDNVAGRRLLVAINSRGDISTNSWLSKTWAEDFLVWARQWSAERSVSICGVSGPEDNCR